MFVYTRVCLCYLLPILDASCTSCGICELVSRSHTGGRSSVFLLSALRVYLPLRIFVTREVWPSLSFIDIRNGLFVCSSRQNRHLWYGVFPCFSKSLSADYDARKVPARVTLPRFEPTILTITKFSGLPTEPPGRRQLRWKHDENTKIEILVCGNAVDSSLAARSRSAIGTTLQLTT